MSKEKSPYNGVIQIVRHGDIAIIVPASEVESMQWDLIQQAAEIVLSPLKKNPASGVIVDLSGVSFFGSVFLSLLLRCHKLIKQQGGEMVICGASEHAKELLRLTALDTIWAIYDNREEALEALA
jgi:anti-anti-sigma factor